MQRSSVIWLVAVALLLGVGSAPNAKTSGRPASTASTARSFQGITLGEASSAVRNRLGRPDIDVFNVHGSYWAYSIDRDRAWLVIFSSAGRVHSIQVIPKANQHSQLTDSFGITPGDSESRLASKRGRVSAKVAQPHVVLYPAGGSAKWMYGIDKNQLVERIGLTLGDTHMPPYIKWYQLSGWYIDTAVPLHPIPHNSFADQERRYIGGLKCNGSMAWKIAGRWPLVQDGARYDIVHVQCDETAFSRTLYFRLKEPRLLAFLTGLTAAPGPVPIPLPAPAPTARPPLQPVPPLKIPRGAGLRPLFDQTMNTEVWITTINGATLSPHGAHVTGPGLPTLELGFRRDPTNPTTGFDMYAQNGQLLTPTHNCSVPPTGRSKCIPDTIPYPNGKLCATIVKHTQNGTNYTSNQVCFEMSNVGINADPINFHQQKNCHNCDAIQFPIDVVTGQLWYQYQDVALSGPFGLTYDRWYETTRSTFQGSLGKGWRSNYDAFLDISKLPQGLVTFIDGQAHYEYFAPAALGQSTYDDDEGATLAVSADGSIFTLTTFSAMVYKFDVGGRLTSITDRIGNTQTIARDTPANGYRILSVTDSLGRSLQFTYDALNRVNTVTSSPTAVNVTLTYDVGTGCFIGDLCSVTESDSQVWSYQYYDPATVGGNHLLKTVLDPLGHIKEANTYALLTASAGYTRYKVTFQSTDNLQNQIGLTYPCCSDNQTNVNDLSGLNSSFQYDLGTLAVTQVSGRLCNCAGNHFYFFYDLFGRLVKTMDGNTIGPPNSPTTYSYGRDTIFVGNGDTNPDGSYVISYVSKAVPGPTSIVEPITTTLSRRFDYTYFPLGGPLQDLVQTAKEPSVDTPVNMVTTTYTRSSPQGLLTSVARQGYIGAVSTTYTTSFTYDTKGRLKTLTGPRTDVVQTTTLNYYGDVDADLARRGQLQNVSDALNHVTNFATAAGFSSYDLYGNPQSVTDPNGVVTDFVYDARGRLKTSTLKGVTGDLTDLVTTLGYDTAGRLTSLTKPLGNGIAYGYDTNDRLTGAVRFDAAGLQYEQMYSIYDNMGQTQEYGAQQCSTPANPCASWNKTQRVGTVYDSGTGLPYQVYEGGSPIDPPGNPHGTYIYWYDSAGNIQRTRDPNHSSDNATYTYDFVHRLTSITQTLATAPGGTILTSYGYDLQDNRNSLTDPNGNMTSYAYDDFGRVRQQVSPVSGTSTYAYDPANDLITYTDANGAVTTRTYDALNRVLSANSTLGAANEAVSYTYDIPDAGAFGIGRLGTITDPSGSTTIGYERRGRIASEARTISGNVYNLAYGYDGNGNRTSVTYPDTTVMSYSFDFADRPYSASAGATTFVSSAKYAPFGPVSSIVYGNGTTQTTTFDVLRYLPAENKLVKGAQTLTDYVYTEDNVGNMTAINDAVTTGFNRSFAYDDINRLTTANSGASLWGTATGNGYTYDSMGNMKTLQLGTVRTATFSYVGMTSKLASVTENGVPRTVAYDSVGNETQVGTATYTYSPRNLLASGDSYSYTYNGLGLRSIVSDGTNSRYAFYGPELQLLSESTFAPGVPAIAYDYVWFAGRPVAQMDAGGTKWTFADHLGTPLLQTDFNGSALWQAEYEPYGKVFALRAGDLHQPLRLPGQVAEQFDTGANGATERSNNVFRWYRPAWGRYAQVDPLRLVNGTNPYEYANLDPLLGWDPLGLWSITVQLPWEGVVGTFTYGKKNGIEFETISLGIGGSFALGFDPNGGPPTADLIHGYGTDVRCRTTWMALNGNVEAGANVIGYGFGGGYRGGFKVDHPSADPMIRYFIPNFGFLDIPLTPQLQPFGGAHTYHAATLDPAMFKLPLISGGAQLATELTLYHQTRTPVDCGCQK